MKSGEHGTSHEAPPLPSEQVSYPGLPELGAAELHRRRETVFLVMAGLFLGTLAMLNILGITRFLDLSFRLPVLAWTVPMPLAVGVLPYPITFLCTDFISELYGRQRANAVVLVGLVLNIWVMLVLWVGGELPVAQGHPTEDVFSQVQHLAFGAVAASMVAYLAAQLVDVQLFHFWKRMTGGRHLWLRNNGSTLVSQLVDSVAVILITHFYAHALPIDHKRPLVQQLLTFIVASYVFKLVAALLDTIPFYIGVAVLSRYLRVERAPKRASVREQVAAL